MEEICNSCMTFFTPMATDIAVRINNHSLLLFFEKIGIEAFNPVKIMVMRQFAESA